jgi:hypothetical protein
VNPVPQLAEKNAGDGWLHHAVDANAVGRRMLADDFESAQHRHAFMSPLRLAKAIRSRRGRVSSLQHNRRTFTLHQDARRAALATNPGSPNLREIDHQRPSHPIIAPCQHQLANAFFNRMLQRVRVIRHTIARRSKVTGQSHRTFLVRIMNGSRSDTSGFGSSTCVMIRHS